MAYVTKVNIVGILSLEASFKAPTLRQAKKVTFKGGMIDRLNPILQFKITYFNNSTIFLAML